jgi:signal transduction histidine kinase
MSVDLAGGAAVLFNPCRLSDFLRTHRGAILDRWSNAMRDRPAAQRLTPDHVLNHLPDLLEAIAATDEARAFEPRARLATSMAEAHALERLADGVDLDHVVIELVVLRECILDVWEAEVFPAGRSETRFLNRSIDRAITAAVRRYGAARDRTLVALDRVSTAAVSSRDLHDFLQRLLAVVVETMPAVEAAALLLREGEALALRAAAGAYGPLRGQRLELGQATLAARVGATGLPAHSTDPREGLGSVGDGAERALYALPLIEDRVVVGVIEVRSTAGSLFSEADERLFAALAARATSSILQHMLRDRSERRAAELDAVLKSVPDAIVVAVHGRISLLNPAARELFGMEATRTSEPYGWLAAMRPRAAEATDELPPAQWPVCIAETSMRPHVADLVLQHGSSGRDVVVRMLAAPVRDQGRLVGVVLVCTDITERRMIEAEREKLVVALQETLQDREHVLAVVAHDLRNPLNTLALAANALAVEGPESPIGRQAVGTVERATRRMDRLIQDLLDASSIRAGRLALSRQPCAPEDIARDVAQSFSARAREKGLELKLEVAGPLPAIVADYERLVQALSNIVGNAVKVSSAGSVVIGVQKAASDVVFSVSDEGPGIAEDLREVVFEPFRRGNANYTGTGLGLAITRGIAEGHGGRVWVESTPGSGATFRLAIAGENPGSAGAAKA